MKFAHRQRFGQVGRRRMPRWLRITLIGLGVVVGLFVVANVVLFGLYRTKVLPNYSVAGVSVGGVAFDQLDERVPVEQLLPAKLTLIKDGKRHEVAPKDLGIAIDWPLTRERLQESRSWLPVLSLVTRHTVPVELTLDTASFAAAAQELEKTFSKAPLPERVVFDGHDFSIAAPDPGYSLDTTELRAGLVGVLEKGQAQLAVPVTVTHSTEPEGKLDNELALLQKRLEAKITLSANGQTRQLTRAQIGRFYEPTGQTMQFSTTKINEIVSEVAKELGLTAVNQNDAASAALYALTKSQPVTFVLASNHARVYRYCTAVKGGVDATHLTDFRRKLAAVYGDPKGWNQGGPTLVYAESDCEFTAWLSAPASMTTFGSICDNYYSCRVGRNVVINFDRWQGATDPWNAAGGSLEDYRVMVINHETGHWFGFGHRTCPGAGQAAPVMQQQSIGLQGCTFNPWPTAAEISAL